MRSCHKYGHCLPILYILGGNILLGTHRGAHNFDDLLFSAVSSTKAVMGLRV